MNKAKKYYINKDGMMVHRKGTSLDETEITAIPFHAKLKMRGLGWINSGVIFYLEDEKGKIYVMNDTMMRKCIKSTDVFIEGDWDFYQQGVSYSIGLIEEG